ncbi:unnamed protein product, partial [Medioppia subpectinata]
TTTVESSDGSSSKAGTKLAQILINYNKISQSPPMNGSTDWLNGFYDLMRTEWTRLRTFHARQDWPHSFITAKELANAGFFYTINKNKVQCAFCRGVISHWKSGDRALSEHSIHFPLCPFIMEMDVGNVPIGRDPIRDPKARHDVCGNMSSYGNTNPVLNSISINRKDIDMNAFTIYMSEFGVQHHNGPKNPEYNSIHARKRSYYINSWDQFIPVSTDSLAEAGFFAVGISDYTKCFYCDGGLSNWEPGDEPWTEHAKWFSDCQFVVLNKSQAFVNECKQMQVNQRHTNSLNENESDPEIYSDYDSDEESVNALGIRAVNEWMNTEIVLQIMDINVGTVDQVKAVLNKRWYDVKQPYTSFAQLYDAIGVVFLPCGHQLACTQCAPCVTDCPICRKVIRGTVKTFFS